MLCSKLVFLGRFPSAHEISQCFVLRVGHPDGCEVTAPIGTRELLCVATVGLDAFAGLRGNERWRDDVAVNAELRELPEEDVSGGTAS
jgi:hypothetical protein